MTEEAPAKSLVISFLLAFAVLYGAGIPEGAAQVSSGAAGGAGSESASESDGYESIRSAFGMTLGASFDPASANEKSSLKDGTPIYGFVPRPGYKAFSQYYVMITPVTKRIYGILAAGTFKDSQEGVIVKRDLMNLLKSKYGDQFKPSTVDGLRHAQQLRQSNRYILVNKVLSIETSVDIRYYDLALRRLAQEEAKSLPQTPGGKGAL